MIVIGVPVPKDYMMDARTASYCSGESIAMDGKWGFVASRDAGVGRSTFAYQVLKDPDVTHLYFMDYDVVPPTGTLLNLFVHDKPIVAGVYPMYTNKRAWSFKTDDDWYSGELSGKLEKVKCLAGSTLLIKREVIEKLPNPCFKIEYGPVRDDGRCYEEGEDEYFSRIAQEAGYELFVDTSIVCEHYNYGRI